MSTRRALGSRLVLLIAALCLVRVVGAFLLLGADRTYEKPNALIGDVRRWHAIATAPGVPYRDTRIEYPPLTWAAAKVIDAPSFRTEAARLVWSQLALDLLTAAALAYGWGRRAAVAYLVLGLVLTLWPFVYIRLDLLSVALAAWGLAWARRHRPAAGGLALGLACLAKLWPLVLLPLLAVTGRVRALAIAGATVALGVAGWVAWGTTRGIVDVVTFRGAKGWQIESVIGALMRAIGTARVAGDQGALRVGRVAPLARDASLLLIVALVVAVCMLLRRVARPEAGLVDGVAATTVVAGLLATSSIFSPQYAVWLLPFAAIAAAAGYWRVAGSATVTCALSAVLMFGAEDVAHGAPWAEVVLMTRNLALVLTVVAGVVALVRANRSAAVGPVAAPVQEGDLAAA
jgi:hypothetical protein